MSLTNLQSIPDTNIRTSPKQIITIDPCTIDFGGSHVWDHSGVTAIVKVVERYESLEKRVTLIGLNEESDYIVRRCGVALPLGS